MKHRRIGIMGGTFNPPHKGHLALAKEAQKKFKLDLVVFMPTGTPPHKSSKGIVSRQHRYKMTQILIKRFSRLKISRIELDRPGYSYAVDTFSRLHRTYGKNNALFYLMGLDSLNDLLNWKKPFELFNFCQFIVAGRPHSTYRTTRRMLKFPLLALNREKIHFMEMKVDISSREIRKRLKEGKSVARQVPAAIVKYIKENNLYG